jgi:hypothetical protein
LFGFAATLIIENTRGDSGGFCCSAHRRCCTCCWSVRGGRCFGGSGRGDWFALFVAIILLRLRAALRRRPYHMPLNVASVRMIAGGIFVGLLFAEPTAGRVACMSA